MGLNFSSCSDDSSDEPTPSGPVTVNPSNVFVNGLPKQVGNTQITTNSDGLVTKITNGHTTAKFSYPCMSRAAAPDVVIDMTDLDYGDYSAVSNVYLNESGYARYVEYVEHYDGDEDLLKMWMEYNADEQISQIKSIAYEGKASYTEVLTFTYTNRNLARMADKYGNWVTLEYGSTPIDNKGCLLDWGYEPIEGDEIMGVIYYAGMLGKPSVSLPVKQKVYCLEDKDVETANFSWVLNTNGFPTKLEITYSDGYTSECQFVW